MEMKFKPKRFVNLMKKIKPAENMEILIDTEQQSVGFKHLYEEIFEKTICEGKEDFTVDIDLFSFDDLHDFAESVDDKLYRITKTQTLSAFFVDTKPCQNLVEYF